MDQRPVVIVNGAGGGVGSVAAVMLTRAGWSVVLTGRTASKLEAVAAQIADPDHTLVIPVDYSDDAATRGVVDRAVNRFGRIDALANIAGFAPNNPIDANAPELWRRTIDGNLSYVVNQTAAAWPHFRKQKRGVIVNVSSYAAIDPFPGFSMYAAVKAALNMFTRVTADEGKSIGVEAVALVIGAVETPMLRAIFSEDQVPREKTMDPAEVAAMVRDCITGARAFESGTEIYMPNR